MTFAAAVYFLCLATSIVCAVLLVRSYTRSRAPLLFWSAICFLLLAVNNLVVVLDMFIYREADLTPWRLVTSLSAICVLLFGFIWRAEQ